MASFAFKFDKPDRKYKAGDTIQCQVIVNNSTKFKARSLSIRFKGYAHTEWEESREETRDGKTTTVYDRYTGDEEYFRNYQYMFGNRNNSTNLEVSQGTNVYNASFRLPNNIPSSFEASNGHIRYNMKAKFDISWGSDKESTVPFHVTSRVDLNEFPHLREPAKKVEAKTFGCCCCESEPMQLMNILPKRGFVPGESIPVTIQIDNGSNVRLESVRVKLKEYITFTTRSPHTRTRSSTKTMKEHVFRTAVEKFQNKVFETTFHLNPSTEWKVFNGCGLISVNYYLKSEAEASGWHSNPDNTTYITIGTIPFNELAPINSQTIPVFNPTAPDKSPVIMEQPLPTYNEASGGIGWNVASSSNEKKFLEDKPSPSFEDIQKYDKEMEAGERVPSAPTKHYPTAPPQ